MLPFSFRLSPEVGGSAPGQHDPDRVWGGAVQGVSDVPPGRDYEVADDDHLTIWSRQTAVPTELPILSSGGVRCPADDRVVGISVRSGYARRRSSGDAVHGPGGGRRCPPALDAIPTGRKAMRAVPEESAQTLRHQAFSSYRSGAQAERRGDAGPVRDLLGGESSPAALLFPFEGRI
jgi:hypothetical protein